MAAGSARMAAPRLVTLTDGVAEATVVPDLGGGLASYDLVGAGGRAPLFRPCRDLSRAGPFDLANNLLVPWSNRISGGGFHFGGRFHPLEPNLPGEPYPIHGNGFSSAWAVENVSAEKVKLSLTSNGPGPFRYEARATYALDAGALNMGLWVRNVWTEALPFGLGFHPWVVRTPHTLLMAKARRVVLESSDHLPVGQAFVSSRPEWDFATPRALPAAWINNAFLVWDGRATVLWSERGLALEIVADPPLSTYIIYSDRGLGRLNWAESGRVRSPTKRMSGSRSQRQRVNSLPHRNLDDFGQPADRRRWDRLRSHQRKTKSGQRWRAAFSGFQ